MVATLASAQFKYINSISSFSWIAWNVSRYADLGRPLRHRLIGKPWAWRDLQRRPEKNLHVLIVLKFLLCNIWVLFLGYSITLFPCDYPCLCVWLIKFNILLTYCLIINLFIKYCLFDMKYILYDLSKAFTSNSERN